MAWVEFGEERGGEMKYVMYMKFESNLKRPLSTLVKTQNSAERKAISGHPHGKTDLFCFFLILIFFVNTRLKGKEGYVC